LRVLLLAQFYAPIIGGEEHAVRNLGLELVRRGHDVTVGTILHGDLPEIDFDDGVRIRRLRSTSSRVRLVYQGERAHAPPLPDYELVRGLSRLLGEVRPDVIHAHNWILHSFLPLKRRTGRPLVLSLHDYSFVCANKRLVRKRVVCSGPALGKCIACAANHYGRVKGPLIATALLGAHRFAARRVDMFLPVSHAVAQASRLSDHALPYEVIPNFVSRQVVSGERDVVDVPVLPRDFILYAGDVTFEKGVETLLRAYSAMATPIPLILAGRSGLGHNEPLPQNVFAIGPLPHEAVLEAFRRCTVAVVPSVWREPSGMVALEAMAMGKTVIASRTGGLSEIVKHDETGVLVSPGDARELRLALERVVADPALRARLGENGRERISTTFSADVVVPRVEDLYARLARTKTSQ
jgi:glycosyltransferase involved in cell wall biosynthesis